MLSADVLVRRDRYAHTHVQVGIFAWGRPATHLHSFLLCRPLSFPENHAATAPRVPEHTTMSKIIAVTGATGAQGGGVVNVMKKTPGWKVRAITRNPSSEPAKKLIAEGIEVVQADADDRESLVKAFEVRPGRAVSS